MGCAVADEVVPGPSSKGGSDEIGRMKILCSHGGKILPKPDGQLRYVGGDTRLVSFNKSITFTDLSCKLEKLFGPNLCLKYQLPNEDLDTLISVTCDDDVENLIEEYDKNEIKDGASRLRAFLFSKTGAPARDGFPCTCHTIDEAKSPRVFDMGSPSQAQVADCRCFSAALFQMPEYLSSFDAACTVHGCGHHHQLDAEKQLSPRPIVDDKSASMRFVRPISPTTAQKEYTRLPSSKLIDSGGRGPALTTSALGSLVSNYHQPSWERRKPWDEAASVNQWCDEKRQVDMNSEGSLYAQQDMINGVSMVRVPSKDRLNPSFMDVTGADSPSVFDRQTRPQVVPRADLHTDALEDGRVDGHFQGSVRLYKPPDVLRVADIPWGPTQAGATIYHAASAESRRNSGDSDEGSHKGHSGAENLPHSHAIAMGPEGPHVVKMQEGYRHEDATVMQQGRHGDFDGPVPQYDPFHHLNKGHFQQVHWQLHDPQDQQQHQVALLELARGGHNSHGMQRHGQAPEYHPASSAHHQHLFCSSNNARGIPRAEVSSVTRLPSPLYRQAGVANVPRADPPSPRRGQILSNGATFTPRHGVRMIPKHDMGYLPSSKPQHSSVLPSSQVFISSMEQSGGQAHLPEKGSLSNLESQAQYFDNVVLSNPEGLVGQGHGAEDELQYSCMSNSHELQGASS